MDFSSEREPSRYDWLRTERNEMESDKVNLAEKLARFSETWSPRIVGELNGQPVKLAKAQGEFFIMPRGVEHKPAADDFAEVLLLEPASTWNTANLRNERTVESPELL